MTPEAIEKAEFPPALRGYDKQQVRVYLQKLGGDYRTLQSKLLEAQAKITQLSAAALQQQGAAEAPEEILSADDEVDGLETFDSDQFDKFGLQIAGLLRDARDSAAQTKSQAELQSQAQLEQAGAESERQLAATQAEADRILAEADAERAEAAAEAATSVEAAKSEAALIRSTVEAEIAERQQRCEDDTKEQIDAANEMVANKQAEADELWNLAEAEAYKVREASRVEAIEVKRIAEVDRVATLASLEADTETMKQRADEEIAELRQQATEDVNRLQIENGIECQEKLLEAEKTLAENQNQATEILAHANSEAEKLMSDAFAEVDRIRLDGETTLLQLRSEAEVDVAAKHEEADAYVSTMTREGDEYVKARRSEADEFYEQRYEEAEEYVAARQGEVFKDAEEAQLARDQAFLEIAEARAQVAELLEQARLQSEFIRQEAEEVIRGKVRANIDQAERRITRLRVTEQASRDRIVSAQRELQSAIVRLDDEPLVELGDGTDEVVLTEATDRVLESGNSFDTEATIAAISEADYGSGKATPLGDGESGDNDSEAELFQATNSYVENSDSTGIDVDLDEDGDGPSDGAGTFDDAEIDLVKTNGAPLNAPPQPNQIEPTNLGPDQPGENQPVEVTQELQDEPMPPGRTTPQPRQPPPGSVPNYPPAELRSGAQPLRNGPGKTTIEEQTTLTDPLTDVDSILAEPAIEPQDEDALSRLVQEAMKRAVESAKRGPETQN